MQDSNTSEKNVIDNNKTPEENNNNQEQASSETDNEQGINNSIKEIINSYKKELEQANDQKLRALAEVQNIRRTTNIDIEKARNFAIEKFTKDLLGTMDSLFIASESIAKQDIANNETLRNILEGIEAIKKDMISAFEKNNITRFNPQNEKFDHNFHQAISQSVDNSQEVNTILSVMQPGYKIRDRVIRPAMVIVSKKDLENKDNLDNQENNS